MKLPDGPGWSPDGGDFWVKGDLLYWSDGSIWDMRDGGMIRTMPDGPTPESEWHKYENFSAWSDEKRAEAVAENMAKREDAKKQQDEEMARIKLLCISAKSKITQEEYEAIQWSEYRGQDPVFMWEELP